MYIIETHTLDGIGLQSTLHQVKENIRRKERCGGLLFVYYHEGGEIRYEESTTLGDIFGGDDGEIKLGFAWPEAALVNIVNEGVAGRGRPVRVMNDDASMVPIGSGSNANVGLKRTKVVSAISLYTQYDSIGTPGNF